MTPVALRLPSELVDAIDDLVDTGRYSSRSELIRVAIEALLVAHTETAIDRALVAGYRRLPQADAEVAAATAATRALIAEEPW